MILIAAIVLLFAINYFIIVAFLHATTFEDYELFDSLTRQEKRKWAQTHRPAWRNIFWWVRFYGGQSLSDFWIRPLYYCPKCMASLHSVIPFSVFVYAMSLPVWVVLLYPLYILSLSGLIVKLEP